MRKSLSAVERRHHILVVYAFCNMVAVGTLTLFCGRLVATQTTRIPSNNSTDETFTRANTRTQNTALSLQPLCVPNSQQAGTSDKCYAQEKDAAAMPPPPVPVHAPQFEAEPPPPEGLGAAQDGEDMATDTVIDAARAALAAAEDAAAVEAAASQPPRKDIEGAGYVEFYYPSAVKKEDRELVEYHQIIGTYHEAVLENDLDEEGCPDLPELGVGRSSQKGPWQLYFNKASDAKKFAARVATVTVKTALTLSVAWYRCIEPTSDKMGFMPLSRSRTSIRSAATLRSTSTKAMSS